MPIEVVSKKQSNLAKLLAEENISIEFDKVSTASFNIETRLLTLPIMKDDLSQEIYDMFTGHEVGHALWTPQEYKEDSITIPASLKNPNDKVNKAIEQNLKNIIEDIRIERLIQRKYPGLRRDFRLGYEDLFRKNFFKTAGKDVNSLGFLNKLNLYAKVGSNSGVVFTPEEQVFFDKCQTMVTFDDVLTMSQEIIDYVATKKQPVDSEPSDGDGDGDSTGIGDDSLLPEGFSNKLPEDKLWDKPEKEDDEEFDPDEPPEGAGHQVSYNEEPTGEKPEDDLDTSTNDEFVKAVQKLLADKSNNTVVNYYIPTFNLDQIIVSNGDFMKALARASADVTPHELNKRYLEYRSQNMPVIKYLVKEFELRKHAQEIQREQIYKTGNLDLKRVAKYQITPDIFRRGVFVPGGKSHGLQIFIDWSSSMDEYLYESMLQLFCITDFCRAISIPFDVYSFRSGVKRGQSDNASKPELFQTVRPGHLDLHHFHMVHMLSSKQTYTQYVLTQKQMLTVWKKNLSLDSCYMSTISTPLNNCIVAAMQIIPNFKKEYNLQIVNSIFITDGASDATTEFFDPHETKTKLNGGYAATAWIHDPETKYFEKMLHKGARHGGRYMTQELLQLLERKTESNVIGFFLTEGTYHGLLTMYNHPKNKQTESLWENDGYAIQYGIGYTVHYCINIANLKIKTDNIDKIMTGQNLQNNAKDIEKAWSIQLNNKLKNRPMLTNFIQHIA